MTRYARVAFVGTGAIGLPMALRIGGGGHEVVVVEPHPPARERAVAAGLTTAGPGGLSDVAGTPADLAVVMVATADQLIAVVDDALAAPRLPTSTWALMSTVGPDAVRAQGARLTDAGAQVLDAPVTGGTAGAREGRLTIFAAGADDVLAAAEPVLRHLGTVRHVGTALGDGQAVKVVNQHLCSVHLVAAAEALHLAGALGLDARAVLDLVGGGAADSWMLGDRGPRMLQSTDVEVTSTVDIFVKDSGLVADAAGAVEVPLLDAARTRFVAAAEAGLGRRDDSRVIETYQNARTSETDEKGRP